MAEQSAPADGPATLAEVKGHVLSSGVQRASNLAYALRSEIQAIESSERPIRLKLFPRGSCGDASLILHSLINDAGIAGSRTAHATRVGADGMSWPTHAWVELSGVILDITPDQFPDGGETIYVGPASPFYDSFVVDYYEIATIKVMKGHGIPELHDFYDRLRIAVLGARTL